MDDETIKNNLCDRLPTAAPHICGLWDWYQSDQGKRELKDLLKHSIESKSDDCSKIAHAGVVIALVGLSTTIFASVLAHQRKTDEVEKDE
jgi:hypothetical protein